MSSPKTNLKVLHPSRRGPVVGDVFAMLPPDGRYLFGRVISTNAKAAWTFTAILIYVYKFRSSKKEVPPQHVFAARDLLLPPLMTNRLPWSKGYFETLGNVPLTADQMLRQHCFHSFNGRYVNEFGDELIRPSEPCGELGLESYRTIDDAISKALGIALVL